MESLIFRRDEEPKDEPKTGSIKNVFSHVRKNMIPLSSFFNESDKSKMAKKLFDRDVNQFNLFISELDKKKTWHEAYQYMDLELKKRNRDILSDEAKNLTDRVYQVFYPDDISIDL